MLRSGNAHVHHRFTCGIPTRHSYARMHMAREVEGLIRIGLPHFVWAMTPPCFRLAFIYQTLADVLAVEMTRYNVIDR